MKKIPKQERGIIMENLPVKSEVLSRLKNARDHIAGIERMVEEGKPCANILIQLSAVQSFHRKNWHLHIRTKLSRVSL